MKVVRYGAEHMSVDPPLDRVYQPGDGSFVFYSSKQPRSRVEIPADAGACIGEGFVMCAIEAAKEKETNPKEDS